MEASSAASPESKVNAALGRHGALALALLACGQLILSVDYTVVYVALPSIRMALGFSEQSVQWVVSAYALTFGGFLLLGGRAADVLGRRRVFISAQVAFGAASLLAGLTPSAGLMVAARGLQGLAAAFLAPATISLISTTFAEGPARNRALGVWGGAGAGGFAFGVLLGGVITEWLGWRWIFLINVAICGISALAAPRLLRAERDRPATRNYDLPGAFCITAGALLLVFALVRAPESGVGWGSAQVLITLAAAVILLVSFLLIEARSSAPLMPLRLFRSRSLSSANAVGALFQASGGGQMFLLTLYTQTVLHYSPLAIGLAFLPMGIVLTVCSNLSGRLATIIGVRATLTIGMTALTAGLLIMAQIDARGSFASEILLGSLLIGIGMGTAWTAMFIGATSGVEPNEQGVASGLVNSSLQIGGAIGLAVLVGIVTSQTRHSSGTVEVATTHALHVAYYVAAAFAAAGAFVAWRLKGRTVRREISTAELPRNVCVGSPAAEPAAVISASGPTN